MEFKIIVFLVCQAVTKLPKRKPTQHVRWRQLFINSVSASLPRLDDNEECTFP